MSANSAGSAATHDRLVALVSPVVQGAGYDLEELILTPMGRRSLLRVVIDRDEGISLDDIAAISHAVGDVLDEDEGVIGKAPYALEVTSPGVNRPLTEPRHWRRAVGRLVEVIVQADGSPEGASRAPGSLLRGRVAGYDGTAVTLNIDGVEHAVRMSDLGAGQVQLEFSRPDEDPQPGRPQRPRRPSKAKKGPRVIEK